MHEIEITGESITLGQLLKLANLVEQGGGAKALLADGVVQVNDEVETRRGRKLAVGDVVAVEAERFVVTRAAGA